ncbi:hypothetical protein QOZ89_44910 [Pseudofrankia sp. BMG5.37]|nr:hypothetical protein [Pseudofrankia sp. BMG5.37]MDT3446661.1 hypothetical protein [Pseudofrankia sp. BMG5.37]
MPRRHAVPTRRPATAEDQPSKIDLSFTALGPDLRVTLVSPGFTDTEGVGKGASPEAAAALARQREEIAMPPSAVAAAVGYAIAQPAGIDISEIVVRPTIQS